MRCVDSFARKEEGFYRHHVDADGQPLLSTLEHEPRINFSNTFDWTLDDPTARVRYNFTTSQRNHLAIALQLPQPELRTREGDVVSSVEALAMAVTAPDGIIVSVYGPVEGRRHNSTMLSLSGLLEDMATEDIFEGKAIYGDPAYGVSEYLCCPFALAPHGSLEAEFKARMSRVREAVEWGFGKVETLWFFINWDVKMRVRQTPVGTPVGKLVFVAASLTNCHTCVNQITMYFGLQPPSLDVYIAS
ncbi:hypothetical protein ON010_g4519 [Phytophthora cinnamomi]|nr:hypothetical protein ON010_g4519 [Phytophthora cinnamomi]